MNVSLVRILVFIFIFGLTSCGLANPGDTPNTPPLVLLQNFTAVMAVSLVIVEAQWMIKKWKQNEKWRILFGIGTIFYALHVVVYYIVVGLLRNSIFHLPSETVFLTDWSSVLRFHGVGFLLIGEIQRIIGEDKLIFFDLIKKKREEI